MTFSLRRIAVSFSLALTTLATASVDARAADSLDAELARVVKIAKRAIDGAPQLRIDPFLDLSAGTKLSGSIRSGLTASFKAECERQGITVSPSATHIFEGRFLVTDEASLRAGEPLVLELHWGLINRQGSQIVEIIPSRVAVAGEAAKHFAIINDLESISEAAGLIGALSASASPAIDAANIALNPSGVSEGSLIRSHDGSPFAAEVLSRPAGSGGDFRPLDARVEEGQPYVDIPIGHEYRVAIHNESSDAIAVAPSIDGLSTFHFAEDGNRNHSTGKLLNRHYIVPPNSTAPVRGWHISNDGPNNVGRFLASNYGDSAANSVGVPEGEQSGAIHLRFCTAVPASRRYGTRSLGTQIGERETVAFQLSHLRPGETVEFLTIRYDR